MGEDWLEERRGVLSEGGFPPVGDWVGGRGKMYGFIRDGCDL